MENVTVSTVDTSTLGEKNVTVTYGDKTVSYKVNVVNEISSDNYIVTGVSAPAFIVANTNNKKEQANKQEEFINKENPYYVGDDNPFKFMPEIVAVRKDNHKGCIINNYESVVTVKEALEYAKENNIEEKMGLLLNEKDNENLKEFKKVLIMIRCVSLWISYRRDY